MNPTLARRVSDRRLYIFFAFIFPVIVLAGFARTYYLKGFFNTPALPSLLVQLHGLVMTAWVILFVVQVWLVSARRTLLHQQLGILGAVLSVGVFLVGLLTGIFSAARAGSTPQALQFLVVPLLDMLIFAILVGLALWFRRRTAVHKRLMLLAAVNMLAPAIARIPIHFIEAGGPLAFFGLTDLVLLACVTYDTIKYRRVHPVFLWGTILIIASQPLRLMLAGTGIWMRFASSLVAMFN